MGNSYLVYTFTCYMELESKGYSKVYVLVHINILLYVFHRELKDEISEIWWKSSIHHKDENMKPHDVTVCSLWQTPI